MKKNILNPLPEYLIFILLILFYHNFTSAQPTMIVKDLSGKIVAKITASQINDGESNLLGKLSNAMLADAEGNKLGEVRMNTVYTATGTEVISGREFGRVVRWRTGNIAFRIDTLDHVVRLVNSFGNAELTIEQYRTDIHFIPLMFYLSFFHSTPSAPPGYEKDTDVLRVALKNAPLLELDASPMKGQIEENDFKVYQGTTPHIPLERRMDVYRFRSTTTTINIEVKYESKEVDVRLLDSDHKLIDPSDALTVDRLEGIKSYPYAISGEKEYIVVVDGYPFAPYSIRVTK